MNAEKILKYLNPRRHSGDNYTEDDIKYGYPVDNKLYWGITEDDNIFPNLFYNTDDGNWWVRTYVEDEDGEEKPVEHRLNADIVAYAEIRTKEPEIEE